jgi:peptide subunit release factor 1 (eRF1)
MRDYRHRASAPGSFDQQPNWRKFLMADFDANAIAFQCPQCGYALEQTIDDIKSPKPMLCSGCGVIIRTDATPSSNVVDEIRQASENVPAEITIKFIDPAGKPGNGA